jgi:hypothetical protein
MESQFSAIKVHTTINLIKIQQQTGQQYRNNEAADFNYY